MFTKVSKLASAVRNNINSGLSGLTSTDSLSNELLEDYVVLERLQVIKEYALKGITPYKDLYTSINCIPIDCKSIEKCPCHDSEGMAHFEIPLLLDGIESIQYLGSVDKQLPFKYYTSMQSLKYGKYRKRKKDLPYVWIDTTPNKNGMCDCFVFNAPLLEQISITAVFKDLRQLRNYACCIGDSDDNFSHIDNEVIKRLSEKMLRYYRLGVDPVTPNNQMYKPG